MHSWHISALQHPPNLMFSTLWHATQTFLVSSMSLINCLTCSWAAPPTGLVSWLGVPVALAEELELPIFGRLTPEGIIPMARCSLLTSLKDLYGANRGGFRTSGGIRGAPPMLLTIGLCPGRGGGDRTSGGGMGTGRGGKDSEATKAAVSHSAYCCLALSNCCYPCIARC